MGGGEDDETDRYPACRGGTDFRNTAMKKGVL